MIVLDTDHVTLLQYDAKQGDLIRKRLILAREPPTTSIITCEEQFRGWTAKLSKARNLSDEIEIYSSLHGQLEFLNSLNIEDFTEKAAIEFQRLRQLKVRIGTMDLKIAAIALANNATLFTRNSIDFLRVPGLRFEDATR